MPIPPSVSGADVSRESGDLPPRAVLDAARHEVRADTRRPGDAYFEGMGLTYHGERVAAWQRDLDAVRAGDYPARS